MKKESASDSQQALNLPASYAKSSGDVFDTKSDCTLALTQEITLQRVTGIYNEVDRKLWLVLAHLSFENLGKKTIHETNLREIAKVWRELEGGRNGTKWLMDSARRLRKAGVDWNDEDGEGTASLLSGLVLKHETGGVFYEFGEILTRKLLDNKVFTRLKIHFLLGLSGKYSVALYMILESLANLRQPTITIPLDTLYERLNVPEGKLSSWKHFKTRALEPAIEQINKGAEDVGFVAAYETVSKGRKIVAVTFTVVKTSERLTKDNQSSRQIGINQAKKTTAEIPPFSASNYETFKQISGRLDIYAEENEWRIWCSKTTQSTANPVGSFIVWLQKRVVAEDKR
jgi:hypothetical protein